MRDHRVAPVDAIWLDVDRVQNLMVIECVLFLEGPVDRAALDEVLRRRLLAAYPVFSRRPVPAGRRGARLRWREVGDLDLTEHVREVRLPAPGGAAELQAYVGSFFAAPLPRDRPLWEIHLIDGLAEGSAVYARLHHALADGISLTQVLLSLTDAVAAPPEDGSPTQDARTRTGRAGSPRPPASRRTVASRRARVSASARAVVRTVLSGARVLGKLLWTSNPPSTLAGRVGLHKQAVWSEPLELQLVKDIAAASGATVNDVLVSALAGAIERYQLEHGARPVDLPTMIPVNVRPTHLPLPRELGNRFALVLLLLPSGLATAAERLAETKRRMDRIKRSPEPALTFALLHVIGRLGPRLSRVLVTFFAGKAIGVTTNVPGPREPRYLAGTRITSLLGWVPGSADQALGTCIFTYAGTVRIGFKTDSAVVAHPERIIAAFHAEMDDLAEQSEADPGR